MVKSQCYSLPAQAAQLSLLDMESVRFDNVIDYVMLWYVIWIRDTLLHQNVLTSYYSPDLISWDVNWEWSVLI